MTGKVEGVEKRKLNWVDMKREDFEAPPQSKPASPGQLELFEPGPGRGRAKPRVGADCPVGTLSLLDLVGPDEE
ncbi:hypothetical protein OK074_2148 [Actinobacteria bacterium OK074]|nr:hypothetical protein OK074_2148 [Actinobacteria bacterium OK074]